MNIVEVSNSPSFADDAVMTSTRNQLAAEKAAGVRHHVALSFVGADLLADSGFMHARGAQENLIRESGQSFTIVGATQFSEFTLAIGEAVTVDGVAHAGGGIMQPVAAIEVSHAVARAAGRARGMCRSERTTCACHSCTSCASRDASPPGGVVSSSIWPTGGC